MKWFNNNDEGQMIVSALYADRDSFDSAKYEKHRAETLEDLAMIDGAGDLDTYCHATRDHRTDGQRTIENASFVMAGGSIVGEVLMLALVDNSPMVFIQVYEPQKETPAHFSAKAKKSWVKNTSTLVRCNATRYKPTMKGGDAVYELVPLETITKPVYMVEDLNCGEPRASFIRMTEGNQEGDDDDEESDDEE